MYDVAFYQKHTQILYVNNANQQDIDSLQFPKEAKEVWISGNFKSLQIPEGIEWISCGAVGLENLHLPDSARYVYITGNSLMNLELPTDVVRVVANNNNIAEISFRNGSPRNLEVLDLSFNKLKRLEFDPPVSLKIINISNNYTIDYINPDIVNIMKT
jgi:hypothetical protein